MTLRQMNRISLSKQQCIPVGCVPSAAVAMSIPARTGHYVSQHTLGRWGVGGLMGGVCPGWECFPARTEADPPPRGQNDRLV